MVFPAPHYVNTGVVAVVRNHPSLAEVHIVALSVQESHPSIVLQSVQAVILELASTVLANPDRHDAHVSTDPDTEHEPHPAIAHAVQVPGAAGEEDLAVYLNPGLQVSHSSPLVAKVHYPQLAIHVTQASGFAPVSSTYPVRHVIGTASAA